MLITLWEDKAAQFQEGLAAIEGAVAFVVITGLLAKQYSGESLVTYYKLFLCEECGFLFFKYK